MTEPTAEDLLADVRRLKKRARADRHAYAAPLLLFGVLIALAPLSYARDNSLGQPLATLYWVASVAFGVRATVWWYHHRGAKGGLVTATTGYSIASIAAGVGLGIVLPLLLLAGDVISVSFYSTPEVTVPALVITTSAASALLWQASRMTGTKAAFATGAGITFATIAFALLSVYFVYGSPRVALLVIALGFLVLAWLERSVRLAVVATLFTASALIANLYNMENMCYRAGLLRPYGDQRLSELANFALPALILLAGGTIALRYRERE
jgi:hypothetical protein